ncbi:amidase family protein [Streptomyces sp. XM4193]|uniref:amidase n=1 Tax=Streptomyces sp. XM4193 TaxID=2929782 RepID=UPI001FF90E8E|nr:amidase family protein [Streptomyces sp. XM4193]MCK1798422.1 amidase family protein [Streptomyces sp. XM4193]
MEYAEYRRHDATGLAELVAGGEVAAGELLETAIARTEAVNGRVNAVVRPMYETARARAGTELNGPFAGVPFLIKDLLQDYEGEPTGSGCAALRDGPPAGRSSEPVRRWLSSGLVVFGKTNTPEFGIKGVTEPRAYGPTRNPWDTARTSGGSSGGSAAAVAAGIVPVAGGNDGGGSLRIPAACCGLFALKPGRGLVPCGPLQAEYLHGAATDGVISRTVRDSARMLDVLTELPDPGGPFEAARPELPYAQGALRAPGRLRIGFSTQSPIGTEVHPEAVAAVESAARLLSGLGHEVEEAETGVDGRQLAEDFLDMWYGQVAFTLDHRRRETGAKSSAFELDTRLLAAAGRATRAHHSFGSHQRWNTHTRALADFHQRYDLLLTPSLARPPVRVGELDTPSWMQTGSRALLALGLAGKLARTKLWRDVIVENLAATPYTQLANITGRPAMSVPLHRTAEGLPLGVQFVGPWGSETTLLALATTLEDASPWADLEPPL